MSGTSKQPDAQKLLGANVHVTGLGLSADRHGDNGIARRLELTRLDIDDVEGALSDVAYRADSVSLDGVHTTLGRGQISAEAADVAEFQLTSTAASLHVRHLSCPSGLLVTGEQEVFAPHASLEDVRLVIEDVLRLGGDSTAGNDSKARGEPIDLHVLDVLQGRLDIDLAVDMTLPWIGRRRATHYFRIPIVSGTIDYEKLEADVHWLEAAFLTVDLVGDRLVLARDLPLLPYSRKALLTWPLEPQDIPVADYRRVHLRNLLRWQLPDKDSSGNKKAGHKKSSSSRSKLTLHALAMENIKLDLNADTPAQLTLADGTMLQFGGENEPGLADLSVTGEIRYRAEQPQACTSLEGSVGLLDVTFKDTAIGGAMLSADRLHIGGIEHVELSFDGFRPRRLELTIGRMTVTNLRVQLPARP